MKVGPNFASLSDYVSQSPVQDAKFVSTFAKTGEAIIQNALDCYANPNRTTDQADNTVADLRDLEKAARALMDKTDGATQANWAHTLADIGSLNGGGTVPIGPGNVLQLKAAAEEHIQNQQSLTTAGHTIVNGRRVYGKEVATATAPQATDNQAGLSHFLVDLHGVVALYATSVAVPGPISASVNSVPEEHASGSLQEQSSSFQEGSGHTIGGSLLLLGGVSSRSHEAGGSQSSTNASFQYDKTTADLDIVSHFLELQDRLDQATLVPGNASTLTGSQPLQEYDDQMVRTGWFNKEEQETAERPTNQTRLLGQEPYQPDHVGLPTNSNQHYIR